MGGALCFLGLNRRQDTTANYIPPNQVGPSNKPPDPDEMAPKMKRSKLAKMVSEEEKWQPPFQLTTLLVQLDLMCLLNKCQFPIWMTCLPESVAVYKVKSRSSLTQKEDGERMNNAGDVGVCEASLSYLLRALCGIRHLEESTYNREYLLEMRGKTRRSCKKGWMILVVLSKKSETCGQRLRDGQTSLQEEAVNLKKTNTDLEAANHEYEVKAAVDFAAGFADAIAQVQVLAPKVDISEAHYTKVGLGHDVDELFFSGA
ncbi:hypothetical protein QL285_084545 [Trifolium repens]|nr:hypothetical protein QL285_084545 [Trifolium repens]